jgi:hypothetical protein
MGKTEFRTACGEYAVMADWSDPACPVMSEGEGDNGEKIWVSTGKQVADFCELGGNALHWHLIQVAKDSGDDDYDSVGWACDKLEGAREGDVPQQE